ncbi:MAG: SPOR domain-containing protein [Candidatus Sumerlaeia bacterium]|nr:SPOR domain-containing protein [Candidatus Sumerlaeia bacterium]
MALSRPVLPLLLLLVLTLAGPKPAFADEPAGQHTIAPGLWLPEDTAVRPRRFAVEVARFPSSALAESVRAGLTNLGWAPIYTLRDGQDTRVLLGNFHALPEATYFAEELRAQQVAEARVVVLRPEVRAPEELASGPVLPAFLATAAADQDPWEGVRRQLADFVERVPLADSRATQEHLAKLEAETNVHERGPAAAALAELLARDRQHPEAALFLAAKVARGEWPADPEHRLRCAELAADLLYGHRRDWRAAWAATQALLNDPARDRNGRTRDRLRQVALLVDLAARAEEPAPSWEDVRAALRRAYDGATVENRRLLAKIELVYMQSFAWQGNWERVEMLAADVVRRYPQQRHETALARVFMARSLERTRSWQRALEQLDIVLQLELSPDDALVMGFEALDLRALARDERARLAALAAGGG